MTIRAVLLGLFGAVVICSLTYFNDIVMQQSYLVGNNMPLSVYGSLILFLLVLNPLLRYLHRRAAFSGQELAVAMALTLAACCVPGSGLMRTFPSSIIEPHNYAKTEAGWKENGVVEMAPKQMLVDVASNEEAVLNKYLHGRDDRLDLTTVPWYRWPAALFGRVLEVPWYGWSRTLLFWLPVILALWLGLMGLSLVVHRQWADHEQLSYPLANFANALLPAEGAARGGVFSSLLFWVGAVAVMLIHVNNYAAAVWPRYLIKVPLYLDFLSLNSLMPKFPGWMILNPTLFFSVIGFAFFLPSEISLSLGIGPVLWRVVAMVSMSYGLSVEAGGGTFEPNLKTFILFGAYLGMFFSLLYTGRHYYGHVARRALFLPTKERHEVTAIWGARVFMISMGFFLVLLLSAGLDWPLAILYMGGCVLFFLVMARILAETGAFFIQTQWFPCAVLAGVFGAQALGPKTILLMSLLSMVLLVDPRESLMPFMVSNIKLMDLRKAPLGKGVTWSAVALLLGLAVAVPVTIWLQYDHGAPTSDKWATDAVPRAPFVEALHAKQKLAAQGTLKESEEIHGVARFAHMAPNKKLVIAGLIGLGLVVLLAGARLRWPKWPLHPVLFLTWATYPALMFYASFLVGWLLKVLVMRFGGVRAYQAVKPLMIGIIAGELFGGFVPTIVSFVQFIVTGDVPHVYFRVLPG